MKLLILTKYGFKGASSRYRFYNYEPYFKDNEIDFIIKPLLDDNYVTYLYNNKKVRVIFKKITSVFKRAIYLLNLKRNTFDAIIIEKELFPNIPYWLERSLLKKHKYLLDFDDYIAASYKTNKLKKIFFENKIDKLVSKASLTTVGNHWYLSEFKKGNIRYLPTVVDINDYPLTKKLSNENIIVWIGSPSTVKYLKQIEPALIKLIKDVPFKLRIIGGRVDLDVSIPTEFMEWNQNSENELLAMSTIGIMPLENTLWEKGKCGFKLIQYMTSGLPVVGSESPANSEIIEHGETGFIARNNDDWYKYLLLLLSDESIANNMGENGRKRVENNYTYQIWGNKFASLIKNSIN